MLTTNEIVDGRHRATLLVLMLRDTTIVDLRSFFAAEYDLPSFLMSDLTRSLIAVQKGPKSLEITVTLNTSVIKTCDCE